MSFPVSLRRPLVVLGVIFSLFAGVATIRAAADWTAASSPLVAKPPSIERLQAALAGEQARSEAFRAQLDELAARSSELTAALAAAQDRIAVDISQARDLQDSLKVAKARLATLERSIRRAQSAAGRTATVTVAAPVAAAAPTRVDGGEEAHDD